MIRHIKPLAIPVLVAVSLASVAQGAFWEWSRTAANNASADPTINFAEGQSPSSVNDSARALMARLADYRDDISGSITTGGTSTAYTITTNQGFDATPVTGQLIAFTPHTTNAASATLTADGGTAFAIQQTPGSAIGAGVLVQGTPYTAKFTGTVWVLRNVYGNPYAVPLGGMIDCTCTSVPNSNFVFPAGQAISRTTYATYFAQVSTTYGIGDGTTTFNVPDLRGRFTLTNDALGGTPANRVTSAGGNFAATSPGQTQDRQNITVTEARLPALTIAATLANEGTVAVGWNNVAGLQGGGGNAAVNLITAGVGSGGNATLNMTEPEYQVSFGGGATTPIVPPAIVFNKLLRIF